MAILKRFIVDAFNKDFNYLEWEFQSPAPIGNKTIKIYKSEHPSMTLNEFDFLAEVDILDYTYIDTDVLNLYMPNRKWYYHLQMVDSDLNTSTLLTTVSVTNDDSPGDYAARHILYLKTLSLERFTQRVFYLLKRRTYGVHCTRCWDNTLYRATDSNCSVCFGTGWVNGYFSPVKFQCMTNSAPTYNQLLPFAKWKPSDVLMTMLNFPNIVEEDVIVDDTGDRWIAVQKRGTQKLGRTIEQQIQISKIMPDDVVYTIPFMKESTNNLITFFDDNSLEYDGIPPIYTQPNLSITINRELFEYGEVVPINNIVPSWEQHDAGTLNKYTIFRDGVEIVSNTSIFNYNTQGLVNSQYYNQYTFKSKVDYNEGAVKQDSNGNNYPLNHIDAGSIYSNEITIKWALATFIGVGQSVENVRNFEYKYLDVKQGDILSTTNISGSNIILIYPANLRDITKAEFISESFTFNILPLFEKLNNINVQDYSNNSSTEYKVFRYMPALSFSNIDINITI